MMGHVVVWSFFWTFLHAPPLHRGQKKEFKRKKNQKSKVWNRSVLNKGDLLFDRKKSLKNPAFFFVFFPSHFLNLIALDEFERKKI